MRIFEFRLSEEVLYLGKKYIVKDRGIESDGHIFYVLQDKEGDLINSYEEELLKENIEDTKKPDRIKSMYAFTKLNKALIYLSSICQWGDAKHGPGPVREDVDYKAKQQAHFVRMIAGEKYDQESGIDHRIAIAFNCLAELQVELKDTEVNDLVTKNLDYFTKEYNK